MNFMDENKEALYHLGFLSLMYGFGVILDEGEEELEDDVIDLINTVAEKYSQCFHVLFSKLLDSIEKSDIGFFKANEDKINNSIKSFIHSL